MLQINSFWEQNHPDKLLRKWKDSVGAGFVVHLNYAYVVVILFVSVFSQSYARTSSRDGFNMKELDPTAVIVVNERKRNF